MYCPSCNTHLADYFLYCTNCGIEINEIIDEQETVLKTKSNSRSSATSLKSNKSHSHGETSDEGRNFLNAELTKRGINFIELKEGRRTVVPEGTRRQARRSSTAYIR